MTGPGPKRLHLAALWFLAAFAVAGHQAARASLVAPDEPRPAVVAIAAGAGAVAEVPLPGRGDNGAHRARPLEVPAVLLALLALATLIFVEFRRRPALPVLHRPGQGTTLRGPPPLLLSA